MDVIGKTRCANQTETRPAESPTVAVTYRLPTRNIVAITFPRHLDRQNITEYPRDWIIDVIVSGQLKSKRSHCAS